MKRRDRGCPQVPDAFVGPSSDWVPTGDDLDRVAATLDAFGAGELPDPEPFKLGVPVQPWLPPVEIDTEARSEGARRLAVVRGPR